jgi:hypothetical protein
MTGMMTAEELIRALDGLETDLALDRAQADIGRRLEPYSLTCRVMVTGPERRAFCVIVSGFTSDDDCSSLRHHLNENMQDGVYILDHEDGLSLESDVLGKIIIGFWVSFPS